MRITKRAFGSLILCCAASTIGPIQQVSATPPPPAPNACAVHFCAEFLTIRSRNGFISPEFEIRSDHKSSAILARYSGQGAVYLRAEIVDGSFCGDRPPALEWTSQGSLEGYILLPESAERSGAKECRSFSVDSLTNPELAKQLRVVWFTTDYTVGTELGQIARNVEARIVLPEAP